jgi:hypothetical protein
MEIAGLAVGVAGLAGLFSTCLDAVEKIDYYRDFGRDSHHLAAQFDSHKLRFRQWGRDVGFDHGTLLEDHHYRFKDPEILSMVTELFSIIQGISGEADGAVPQRSLLGNEKATPSVNHLQQLRGAPSESRKKRLTWAIRGKDKRRAQVEEFGTFIQLLHDIVPPEGYGTFTGMKHGSGRLRGL